MPRRKRDEVQSVERDAKREERILMYQDRASKGLGIFNGEPIPDDDDDDIGVEVDDCPGELAMLQDAMLADAVA